MDYINGYLCVLGTVYLEQGYRIETDSFNTWGRCPVCGDILVGEFSGYVDDWFFNSFASPPKEGTFEIEMHSDSYYRMSKRCVFHDHCFIVTYKPIIPSPFRSIKSINCTFNLKIPFKSDVTMLLIEQTRLLKWYIHELYSIGIFGPDYSDIETYLRSILSWDSPLKCELFYKFSKKICKDIALLIVNFVDWF